MSQKQVVAACKKLFARYKIKAVSAYTQRGCAAVTSPGRCTIIYVDKPFRSATPKAIRRHELGHCNGWPANHQ